jgi:serine/threonine protein kinase
MLSQIILTITSGKLAAQNFIFNEIITTIIGRADDCHPKLPNDQDHSTISRYHCVLDINPPNVRVRDYGSLMGTYVNGTSIGQRKEGQISNPNSEHDYPFYDLKEGDEIRIGNTVFRVSIEIVSDAEMQPEKVAISAVESDTFEIIQRLLQQAKTGEPNLSAIQGYTIKKELGKGGFGAVYLACHNETEEEIALKVMLPQRAADRRDTNLFLREIENTKLLQHLNLVQLRDSGEFDGTFFFTLDYCNGGSIAQFMRQQGGRLPIDTALEIIFQTLDGLEYAHNVELSPVNLPDGTVKQARGLVHRDLKPSNIFLTNVGGKAIAKVGDHGLAKAFDLAGLSGHTPDNSNAWGTPCFMPRQQVLDFKYVKPDVDVWAAAACLYNMLTGLYPRNFPKGQDALAVALNTQPIPIRQRNALIPKNLAEVIDLALIDKPKLYFKTAAELKQALQRVM